MDKLKAWIKKHKVWSAVIGLFLIGLVGSAVSPQQPQPQQQSQQAAQNEQKAPEFKVVKEWGVGNKAIVIDPSDASEEKLTLLGKELNKRYGNADITRIGVFTDRSQAEIQADLARLDALSGEAEKAYDKAYIAQFNVNKATGFKQYTLYPTGQTKVIDL